MKSAPRTRPAALVILGAFTAAVLIGLLVGAYAAVRETAPPSSEPPAANDVAAPPPTEASYRAAAAAAVGPFLAEPSAETAASSGKALLELRVPATARTAHLELVLLLDRWTREPSQEALDRLLAAQPWLTAQP